MKKKNICRWNEFYNNNNNNKSLMLKIYVATTTETMLFSKVKDAP